MHKRVLNTTVGANIRNERQAQNITREELAEIMKLSTAHIGMIERGERGVTANNLVKLAKVLGVPIGRFTHSQENRQIPYNEEYSYNEESESKERLLQMIPFMSSSEVDYLIQSLISLRKAIRMSKVNHI
jgi:transcriptional regulator with XRE-family HTH domain